MAERRERRNDPEEVPEDPDVQEYDDPDEIETNDESENPEVIPTELLYERA